ncbi:MAG TPA: hypothetical protein HPP94_02260 [Desulfuromonadales bacterium]|nr:hypothetical protein [Desulfuromonadales bacterium]
MALFFSAVTVALLCLSGCGSDGDADDGDHNSIPAKAVIAFKTSLPVGSPEKIGSVDLVFELPTGVTLATPAGTIPTGANGLLKLSGEAARFAALPTATTSIIANYTPATATSNATVSLSAIATRTDSGQGMDAGVFATLTCDITPGVTVTTANFKPLSSALIGNATGTKLFDTLGGITGPASASYNVTLQ